MGVVYLARDMRLGRLAALKTLGAKNDHEPEDDDAVLRFRREAQLAASLSHPNIVTLYEVGYENKRFTYLAMEYVEGESLLSMMRRVGRLPVDATCRIIDDVLQALAYAHDRGIIHRDIKPANILLSTAGPAKITDFGVARLAHSSSSDITERGQLLGTPHYMSPEQIAGREIDVRSDLFSAGVVMFEMLAARKPFDGAGLTDVLYNVVNQQTPELLLVAPGTPHWAAAFVEKLLAKAPEDRFASAAAAARELRRLMILHGVERERDGESVESAFLPLSADETPTTPIMAPDLGSRTIARRVLALPVPQLAGLAAVMMLLAISGWCVYAVMNYMDDTPSARFHPGQLEELESKKQALAQAELLYEVGAFEESKRRFAAYLKRYPDSQSAREGLQKSDAAIRAIAARRAEASERDERPSRRKAVRTASARESSEAVSEPPQNSEKRSVWSRVKGWFRR